MIQSYLEHIKKTIAEFDYIIEIQSFNEKFYSDERGYIQGEIIFTDNSKLDFTEVKDIQHNTKIKFHYHYMDSSDNLIFRYDNSKHHHELKTFPHHKHLKSSICESDEPDILSVMIEIETFVIKR